uniref:Uncharacterized protein n=1 Tax=Anopheles atroparvus TaxID=41427 RepID=A0A182IKR8_ANOAO
MDRRPWMVDGRRSTVDGRRLMVDGPWSTVDGRWSMVDVRRSTVDGRWSTVDGRRSTVDGRRSTVDGRWSMVDGRRSTVDGRWSTGSGNGGTTGGTLDGDAGKVYTGHRSDWAETATQAQAHADRMAAETEDQRRPYERMEMVYRAGGGGMKLCRNDLRFLCFRAASGGQTNFATDSDHMDLHHHHHHHHHLPAIGGA